jgi:F0F1-type ATP synthase assembly protein I
MKAGFPEKILSSAKSTTRLAQEKVLEIFNRREEPRLVFHNYALAAEIAARAAEIAKAEGLEAAEAEAAQIAAWFLLSGFVNDYSQPYEHSLAHARQFLEDIDYTAAGRKLVFDAVRTFGDKRSPNTPVESVVTDAYNLSVFAIDFIERSPLMKLERELLMGQALDRRDWTRWQLQSLLRTSLYTHFAKTNFQQQLSQQINEQKKRSGKNEAPALGIEDGDPMPDEEPTLRPFQDLEKKLPTRATQTFFRANYRNHINLSAIADNKANIMISVNSILISVLISMLTYRNISETNPMVLLPVIIFLVTGLASLIFAVLSARPKVTMLNYPGADKAHLKRNIIFFGNFVHLDLEEYEEAMDALFRDDELLYGNMTRDLYYLGKVLDKKYRYLSISYNIFMVGFVATVSTFLFALLR